ncbi:50S ribosomal protein L11 methyltransferase [Opitutaceae bacterium EW11]|nr:50S ribosomal protein L11 methyltransferase [Opitutaceae bacterium EW11]
MVMQDLPSAQAQLVGLFASEDEANEAWDALRASSSFFPTSAVPHRRQLAEQDWKDSYKAHFKPSQFGRLHWVPIWERESYRIPTGDAVIWLDPGLAFGTGNHETTRLCCERLVRLAPAYPPDTSVIDAGCGSGILALSAARLGFSRVVGFDNDPEAVRVSVENAALNNMTGAVDFFVGDLITGLAGRTGKIVFANIQADVLMRFADQLLGAVEPGGALILSGILSRELEQVRGAFAEAATGWSLDSRTMGEWSDLLLRRPA